MATPTSDPLYTFHALPLVVMRLARRGVDPRTLLRACGLPEAPAELTTTAPLSRWVAFLDGAADALADPILGITLANEVPETAIGYPLFAAKAAPTARDGLIALHELAPLINPILHFTLEEHPPHASVECSVRRRGGLGRHLNEHALCLTHRFASEGIPGGLPLERVWLPHHEDTGRAELERRLRCRVELGADSIGLAFSVGILALRPLGANEQLFEFLREQGKRLLATVGTDDVIAAFMGVVEPRLDDPLLDLKKIARLLAMSERSLQRRLVAAGTSYRDLLDHMRHRRFLRLRRNGLSIEQCAAPLGYADVRGLRRAIARWR